MKKRDPYSFRILQQRREKKLYKRRKKGRNIYQSATVLKEQRFFNKIDQLIVSRFRNRLYEFLSEHGFFNTIPFKTEIVVPTDFSLKKNYEATMHLIKVITRSFYDLKGEEIVVNFSRCETADVSALFFLQIIRIEFSDALKRLEKKVKVTKVSSLLKVIESKNDSVNRLLLATGLLSHVALPNNEMVPISTMGYLKGTKSRKHYLENRKGIVATNIGKYFNQCLAAHAFALSPQGINNIEGIVSEVLNNAEDHSPYNTWYVTAVFFKELAEAEWDDNTVGEINLSFLNFGYSIYQGLETTKDQNKDVYQNLEDLYNTVKGSSLFFSFTKEHMFTLYALQEGISRLRFENESRGTGTMKFINSFLGIGDYEDKDKGYIPCLSIVSGNTQLICDNTFKPYNENGRYFLSLNQQNDLRRPPEPSHLMSLKSPFPGTLLNVKLFLNEKHLIKKIQSNGNV